MDFQAVSGDITTIKTDAVVLPANTGLKEGSGASEAVFSKAGRKELTAACKALAPVEVGSAIATPAYNLSAEYILHAVVPKWQGGTKNEYALLSSAYLSCLTVADAMGCESIAFPLLAAGNNGFNLRLAIQIAKETISGYQPENQLKTVFLVVYTEAAKVMMIGSGISVHPMIPAEYFALAKEPEDAKKKAKDFIGEKLAFAQQVWKDHKKEILACGIMVAEAVVMKKVPNKEEIAKIAIKAAKEAVDKM
jgi:O-acetyl-ADP-ribose deacetylase (regulator of RNase III)